MHRETVSLNYRVYRATRKHLWKLTYCLGVQQVGRIAVEFSEDELSSFEHKRHYSWKSLKGTKVYRLDFQITIDFGGQAGLLEVRSLVHGRETGRTTIDFE